MKKSSKRIGIIIIAVVVLIQFWPVDRSNPPVTSDIPTPQDVKTVLRDACYDCHSNESVWPWYAYVAPVSWLVASDVHEARGHFNLSEWDSIPANRQAHIPEHMWEEVEDGEMPLLIYKWMHAKARLSQDQKDLIRDWSESNIQ